MKAWKIKDWGAKPGLFEVAQSRRYDGALSWFAHPVNLDGEHYAVLMASKEGQQAYGIWTGLLQLAASMGHRGFFIDLDGPLSVRAMATRIRVPLADLEAAIEFLSSPEIGWLQAVSPHKVREIVKSLRARSLGAASESARSNVGERSHTRARPRASESKSKSSSGFGSSEGGAGETAPPAADPLLPRPETPQAVAYAPVPHRSMRSALEATPILEEYPQHKRVKRHKAIAAVQEALDRIESRGQTNPAEWLRARVAAFRQSPAGNSGRFVPDAHNWFADGCYDDPPEAWQAHGEGSSRAGTSEPTLDEIAAMARRESA